MKTAYCVLCGQDRPAVADPLKAQVATPGRLASLTRGLTRAQLLYRPAPGKWSIHEIVCHLADTEVANAWRYRKVLAEDEVGLTAWDQDRWAAGHQYRRQDFRLAMEQFRILRTRNLGLLKAVGRKAWHAQRPTRPSGRSAPPRWSCTWPTMMRTTWAKSKVSARCSRAGTHCGPNGPHAMGAREPRAETGDVNWSRSLMVIW